MEFPLVARCYVLARRLLTACATAKDNPEATMNTLYYHVIGLILLYPWALVGFTLLGYCRRRWALPA